MANASITSLKNLFGKQFEKHSPFKRFLATLLGSHLAFSIPIALCLMPSTARAMDLVREETRVNEAISTFGVTGQGVIVAIMDRGIDWRNNDFRNGDGTTRIAYIFDLTDDTGAQDPDNPYGMGTIYTRAQIDQALSKGTNLTTRDAVGHGTTTTGIACGNGRNLADLRYRGVAPNATIISVKITSDGAPAHDGEPAEDPFWDPRRVPVAINFVRDKAAELGRPCVMLLNLGSIGGPTDGTSELARKVDETVGPSTPGLIFVTGTGDDGNMPNHAGGTVDAGGSAPLQIQKASTDPLYFDLWYGGDDRFDVTIQTPNGSFGPYPSPPTNDDFDIRQQTSNFLYYHLGSNRDFHNATNDKRELWIRLDGPPGNYVVQLQSAVTSGRFDATINPSFFWQSPFNNNRFLNYVVPGSIWDMATAYNNVAPNSYVIRTNWVDIDGIPRSLVGEGNVNELWLGSSVGPTFDGRLGVDVSAPGDRVITSYNPRSYWATFRFNLIQGGNGLYGMAGAVSAAAPIVTGIIALMLEMNPQLDALTVKTLLQQSARADEFTGKVPNPIWGYGKVDAYAALERVNPSRFLGFPLTYPFHLYIKE